MFPGINVVAVSKRCLIAVVLFVLGVLSPAARAAVEPTGPMPIVRINDDLRLDEVGNATGEAEIVFPVEFYHRFKTLLSPRERYLEDGKPKVRLKHPTVGSVLRYLGMTSTAYETSDVTGAFDDEAATIQMRYRILGRAVHRRGQWSFGLGYDPEQNVKILNVKVDGDTLHLEARNKLQNVQYITRLALKLPAGATQIEYQKKSEEVTYSVPLRDNGESEQASSRPEFRFEGKRQLMSALYKLYGNPKWAEMWAARSVLHNSTGGTLGDYRVRFRLDGYSGWSPWQRRDKVLPGQTVVASFYPVIDSKIIQLKGRTPALIEAAYEYTRPDGEKVSETETQRIELLGMNEAVWSSLEFNDESSWFEVFRNAPLVLSSFTTATDPVIQDVVGMISKSTAGKGASLSDENALAFLGTLYNLLRTNIAYETTPGGMQGGIVHQHLKYGRDVLRTRSGTCVNLAILYASVAEAAGLDPYIVLIPGHAFAAVKLPQSGQPVFVETTGCGGGTQKSSSDFVEAREAALRSYQQAFADGLLIEVSIAAARKQGVPSPELPEVGQNPLKEWGIDAPAQADRVHIPKLLSIAKSGLSAAGFKYTAATDKTALQLEFTDAQGAAWTSGVITFEDRELVVFCSIIPAPIPEERRAAVAAVLAASNGELVHGNFELSKEGKIVFRTSTDVQGGLLTPVMVGQTLQYHVAVMKKHLASLRQIAQGTVPGNAPRSQPAVKASSPAPDDGPSVPVSTPKLAGTWKSTLTDPQGVTYTQLVTLKADGRYAFVIRASNGQTTEMIGTWTYAGGVLTTQSQYETRRGTIQWAGPNRFTYTTNDGMKSVYDRFE